MARKKLLFGCLIIFGAYFITVLLFIEPHLHYRKLLIEAETSFRRKIFSSYIFDGISNDKHHSNCPELRITHRSVVEDETQVKCQQHVPTESGCKYASEYFIYDKEKRRCDENDKLEICKIFEREIKCSYEACGSSFRDAVYMQIFDTSDGQVKAVVESASNNDEDILYNLLKYAKISSDNGHGFIFVSCNTDIKRTQLILIDDIINVMAENGDRHPGEQGEKISINVLLLDSLSRAHFYRSLQQTISTFNDINKDNETEVLDFELFQALHGHTVENLHAFFSGFTLPANLTDDDREKTPIGVDKLYKFLKGNNYQTIYQDDMCYEAVWGMRLDLGNPSSWEDFVQAISDANIDNTGITMASCKILELLGEPHVFNTGEDEKLCFNGKAQDAYYLQKLVHEFKQRPNLFAFTGLMFSHDAYGIRTQTLDGDLSQFVADISKLQNTVTILMADHGNAYTDFVYLDSEGQYEMFHPSLFMILPQGVQKRLGSSAVAALRKNQKRLVTQLDLHHTVKYLADGSYSNRGLLDVVSPARTCNDLPLRQPNLCLCKGSNTPVQNTSEYIGHLEFAVGKLNNIIVKSSPRKCKLLVPIGFDNVIQRHDGSHMSTMFNVITKPGFQSKNDVDRFAVELSSVTSGSVDTLEMKLDSYDRLSKFGGYRKCSDADDKFRLCVCDFKTDSNQVFPSGRPRVLKRKTSFSYNLFERTVSTEEKIVKVSRGKLLVNIRTFYERKYDDDNNEIEGELLAVSFEAINVSRKKESYSYHLLITFTELENMKQTTVSKCEGKVAPKSIIYLCTLVRKYSIWKGSYEYKIDFERI